METTSDNWYDAGTPGDPDDDYLNRSSFAGSILGDADATDADPCIGTGDVNCLTKSDPDFTSKRSYSLDQAEGGGDLWDLGGNACEWVADLNHRTNGHGVAGAAASGYQALEIYVGNNASDLAEFKLQWGPTGDHTAKSAPGERGGLGQFTDDNTPGGDTDPANPGAVFRGGNCFGGGPTGPFMTGLSFDPSYSSTLHGFRCVFAP